MCVFFFVFLHLQMITLRLRAVMWQFVFVFAFSFVFYIDDYLQSSDMAGHHLCVCVCVFYLCLCFSYLDGYLKSSDVAGQFDLGVDQVDDRGGRNQRHVCGLNLLSEIVFFYQF